MRNKTSSIKKLIISNAFNKVLMTEIISLILMFFILKSGLGMLSGINTYLKAGNTWSFIQRQASENLLSYVDTKEDRFYGMFAENLKALKDFTLAWVEMQKRDPDVLSISADFRKVGVSFEESRGLLFLYKVSQGSKFGESFSNKWEEADLLIDGLDSLGIEIRYLLANDALGEISIERIQEVTRQVRTVDSKLLILGNTLNDDLFDCYKRAHELIIKALKISLLIIVLAATIFIIVLKNKMSRLLKDQNREETVIQVKEIQPVVPEMIVEQPIEMPKEHEEQETIIPKKEIFVPQEKIIISEEPIAQPKPYIEREEFKVPKITRPMNSTRSLMEKILEEPSPRIFDMDNEIIVKPNKQKEKEQEVNASKNVLLVDDKEETKKLVNDICGKLDLNFMKSFSTAREAFDWIDKQNKTPDLVIYNINTSDIKGYDFADMIKVKPKYARCVLVAITDDAKPGTAQKVKESGFSDYVPRLLMKSELQGIIENILG
ncbi:MAG: response regulator [Candidatus Omnitrophica bacterium]|nr:response regulator [Candidatus Omnitrophota bacterium]